MMLFSAIYKDGTCYNQNEADTSIQEEGKNAYFDIFYKPFKPLDDLVYFSLSDGTDEYRVFLTDGHFEINGKPFRMHGGQLKNFNLEYWKKNQVHINATTGKIIDQVVVGYQLGWWAMHKGHKIKRVMEI